MVLTFELTGVILDRVVPRFLPYSMSQGFRPPVRLVGWDLRCPPLWGFFGRQFLMVARKPSWTTDSLTRDR